jgi:hypothetical protein
LVPDIKEGMYASYRWIRLHRVQKKKLFDHQK